ncbi:heat shock factor-binding protein 1-like [Dipodomys spectabilis]|uniref:heat shock factor-binding protein 1-like n=1 Tax=Dipodomys spectabilis TaxID=105255 RepID=UPI001C53B3A3|nr:heat shock factor-binding protein 1-like [Dipodomys spectabilis]
MDTTSPKNVPDFIAALQMLLQQMHDKFQIMSEQITEKINDMSSRTDDLEKTIANLMSQAGVEDPEGEHRISATHKG